VPFAFPLAGANDKPLLDELGRRGVDARRFWSTPHPLLPAERFPAAARRRATAVALPVHQELRPEDLERIAGAARGPSRPRRTEIVLQPIAALEDVREEWSALAETTGNVFGTWEWAATWWRHFGGHRPLRAFACRVAGRLVAVLPLYEWRSTPLRVLRLLGHGAGDQLGPVCRPGERARAANALRRAAAKLGADVVVAENVAAEDGWAALLGATVLRRSSSPVLALGAGSAGSSRLQKRLRYEERRLQRDHRLEYRLAGEPGRLDEDLDALFALHRAHRPDEASAFGPQEHFQRDFARAACERGWLRLWFLDLDGAPAAAWYGFRFGGAESHYQGGRDPRWERHSLGLLLLAHTIEQARADGLEEYRFLRGGEAYKHRFASHDPGLETVGLARGPGGKLALAGWRLVDATRRAGAPREPAGAAPEPGG
jgi:CelD/BcsL family acetyltransferase involved in cellulose biosynthesis